MSFRTQKDDSHYISEKRKRTKPTLSPLVVRVIGGVVKGEKISGTHVVLQKVEFDCGSFSRIRNEIEADEKNPPTYIDALRECNWWANRTMRRLVRDSYLRQ